MGPPDRDVHSTAPQLSNVPAVCARPAAGGPILSPESSDSPRRPWPTPPPLGLVGTALVATILLVGLTVAARLSGLSLAEAVADPQETTDHRFLGVVSNVGILLWAAMVAVALFAATLVDTGSDEGREWRRFLVGTAAVALLLLVDDFLLVHEFGDDVARAVVDFEATRARKDIIETGVFALYGLVVVVFGLRFRASLRQLDLRPLAVAGGLLAFSFAVDLRMHRLIGITLPDGSDGPDLRSGLEEGPKFLGIALLLAFVAGAARHVLAGGGATTRQGRPAEGR